MTKIKEWPQFPYKIHQKQKIILNYSNVERKSHNTLQYPPKYAKTTAKNKRTQKLPQKQILIWYHII